MHHAGCLPLKECHSYGILMAFLGECLARARNELRTQTITLSTTPQVLQLLRRLLRTGLYGKNTTEAAERLLARGLEVLIANGQLPGRRSNRL